jgi:hypothetical protein
VPHEQGWALKREGESKIESVHSTQKDAIDAGRDMARQDEVDLVVHRQDGTFRNVLTYTNDAMVDNTNGNGNGNGKRVQAHDIFSVGSRVSWGALLAGAAVSLAILSVLWMGGLALGWTVHDRMGPRALTIAGAAWMLVSTLLALFCGGFAVSRITTGETKAEAALYGVALWGLLFGLVGSVASTGTAAAAMLGNTRSVSDRPAYSADNYRDAGVTSEERVKFEDIDRKLREGNRDIDPNAKAWWGFASLALSLGAAVLGSILGAGPGIVLLRMRGQRMAPAQIQPS